MLINLSPRLQKANEDGQRQSQERRKARNPEKREDQWLIDFELAENRRKEWKLWKIEQTELVEDRRKQLELQRLVRARECERQRLKQRKERLERKKECERQRIVQTEECERQRLKRKKERERQRIERRIERERQRIERKKERVQQKKLRDRLRLRIRGALKGISKSASTIALLGCTASQAWSHLEKQFKPGMTRENHGLIWHIDHIRPCASFDLSQPEQQRACFHFSNLQPLFILDNLRKGARYVPLT